MVFYRSKPSFLNFATESSGRPYLATSAEKAFRGLCTNAVTLLTDHLRCLCGGDQQGRSYRDSLERIVFVAHVAVVDHFQFRGWGAVCVTCFGVYKTRTAMLRNR